MQAAAFDAHAIRYDQAFTHTAVGRMQRNRVWKLLTNSHMFQKQHTILEVNCGTGADAEWFASFGHQVLATDVSGEMIEQAKSKLSESMASVLFQQVDFQQIETQFSGKTFSLIFSNFGGLNCVDTHALQEFLKASASLLPSGGSLVVVLMPAFCLWETIFYLAKIQPFVAFRRFKERVYTTVEGSPLTVFYHPPERVISLASNWFTASTLAPVGLALPPSYTARFFERRGFALSLLNRAEEWLAGIPGLSSAADHYFLHLIRK